MTNSLTQELEHRVSRVVSQLRLRDLDIPADNWVLEGESGAFVRSYTGSKAWPTDGEDEDERDDAPDDDENLWEMAICLVANQYVLAFRASGGNPDAPALRAVLEDLRAQPSISMLAQVVRTLGSQLSRGAGNAESGNQGA